MPILPAVVTTKAGVALIPTINGPTREVVPIPKFPFIYVLCAKIPLVMNW